MNRVEKRFDVYTIIDAIRLSLRHLDFVIDTVRSRRLASVIEIGQTTFFRSH